MADVKWIKITTDIFDDEKIMMIESLPEADAIIVIWFKLLCLAGKSNHSGVLLFCDRMAYTDKMLSVIFRRKESVVKLALETFETLGMIQIVDNVITIPNWGKHQNLDSLENKREYMRSYMQKYRKKQAEIACETNCKTNSETNVSRTDIEVDKEKEVEGIYNNINNNKINVSKCSTLSAESDLEKIPLCDGTEWKPSEEEYQEYSRLFPDVNIETEFRKMRSWCNANTKKTRRGIKRFVNAWLSRAQDNIKSRSAKPLEERFKAIERWAESE